VLATRPNTTDDELDNLVTARLSRQGVLARVDPAAPLLWALIDGGVQHRPVASAEVIAMLRTRRASRSGGRRGRRLRRG